MLPGVNSGVEFWVFLGEIWLIFCLLDGNFKFFRGLHHVGFFKGIADGES